ncbi:MAG: hypothetical protein DMG60_22820 [Acidobacteria bacterium]|nr:MAG: hypothetical protein DMG60_22820 [Acidobacteriota bacterium]
MLLAMLGSPIWGQPSSYDPAASRRNKAPDSFAEFALRQINPQNTEYGCQLEAARKVAVDETVKSIDSWTVLVTFSFLILSFLIILHQHNERNRREVITANFLAQYHNAWVDAKRQTEETIRRYNELVNARNPSAEANLGSQSLDPDGAQASTIHPPAASNTNEPLGSCAAVSSNGNRVGRREPAREMKLPVRESHADLIAQISTLQQQLNASHEREKQLQRELNRTQRRMPPAQAKEANVTS